MESRGAVVASQWRREMLGMGVERFGVLKKLCEAYCCIVGGQADNVLEMVVLFW